MSLAGLVYFTRRNNYGTSEVVVQTTESLEQLSHK